MIPAARDRGSLSNLRGCVGGDRGLGVGFGCGSVGGVVVVVVNGVVVVEMGGEDGCVCSGSVVSVVVVGMQQQ